MDRWQRLSRFFVLAAAVGLIAALSLAAACGGGDDDDGGGDGTPAATTPGENGDDGGDGGDGGELSFDVSMGDNFFEPNEFSVPAGAKVTFNLTNDGAAIHNMRIAGDDGEYNTDDDAVSDPDLVSAGGTAVLEWVAPDQPGEVDFQCDFHPTDMVGTITVE